MLQQRNVKKNLSTIKEVPEEYQSSTYLNKSKISDMNINHSKENIDEYKPVKNHYKIEAKPKIYTTSDIEGRVDLLILFLIDCGYISENNFTRSDLRLLRNKLPKDYTERDFQRLEGIIRKTIDFLTKRNVYKAKVRKQLKNPVKIVLVGDLFGNRPLCYKVNKNGKTIVNLPEDGNRGDMLLSGTKEENDFNYRQIIYMNNAISEICTLLAYDQNVYLVGGNHEVFGSYSKCGSFQLDNFYRNDTGLPKDKKEIKHFNNNGNELDDIKKHFIGRLNKIGKPLLKYKSFDIGEKKFLFKHTPYLGNQDELNYMCNDTNKQLVYDEFFADKTWLNDWEKTFIMQKKTSDFITNGNLKNNNVVLVYGHTSHASENQSKFDTEHALCVDCDIFEQTNMSEKKDEDIPKDAKKNVNFFEILDNGNINEKNFHTNSKIRTFNPLETQHDIQNDNDVINDNILKKKRKNKKHKRKYFIPICALTGEEYRKMRREEINKDIAKNNTKNAIKLPIITLKK